VDAIYLGGVNTAFLKKVIPNYLKVTYEDQRKTYNEATI